MKQKLKQFLAAIWKQLKDKTNLVIFVLVFAVMYAPTWLVGLLGAIFDNAGMVAVATAYAAFWASPFTPFFPIVISVTFAVRKIVDSFRKK